MDAIYLGEDNGYLNKNRILGEYEALTDNDYELSEWLLQICPKLELLEFSEDELINLEAKGKKKHLYIRYYDKSTKIILSPFKLDLI